MGARRPQHHRARLWPCFTSGGARGKCVTLGSACTVAEVEEYVDTLARKNLHQQVNTLRGELG